MPRREKPDKEELVRLRAMALSVQNENSRVREDGILEQARQEIEREAKTLEGEQGTSDSHPARLA